VQGKWVGGSIRLLPNTLRMKPCTSLEQISAHTTRVLGLKGHGHRLHKPGNGPVIDEHPVDRRSEQPNDAIGLPTFLHRCAGLC
jgi:hypothetical protein